MKLWVVVSALLIGVHLTMLYSITLPPILIVVHAALVGLHSALITRNVREE